MKGKLTKSEQAIKTCGLPRIFTAGIYSRTHEMFMGRRPGFEFFGFGIFKEYGDVWIELTILNHLCTIGFCRRTKIVENSA